MSAADDPEPCGELRRFGLLQAERQVYAFVRRAFSMKSRATASVAAWAA